MTRPTMHEALGLVVRLPSARALERASAGELGLPSLSYDMPIAGVPAWKLLVGGVVIAGVLALGRARG